MKKTAIAIAGGLLLTSIGSLGAETVRPRATPGHIRETLGRLEAGMSALRSVQTGFVQQKQLAVFEEEIVLRGKVFLKKPDHLAWHVDEPIRYSLVITGDTIRQWDEETDRVYEIALGKNPAFQVVVDQLQEWFSGSYSSLLDRYEIKIRAENPVVLECTPRPAAPVHRVIESITVEFRKDERYLQRILIREKNGDNTILTFVETRLNDPIDAAAWEVAPRGR